MTNPKNFCNLTGIVLPTKKGGTESCHIMDCAGGHKRVLFTIMVGDNYKSRFSPEELASMSEERKAQLRIDDKGRGFKSQAIGVTDFLPMNSTTKQPVGLNRYLNMKPGDMVTVSCSVKATSFVDKNGVTQYTQTLEVEEFATIRHAAN